MKAICFSLAKRFFGSAGLPAIFGVVLLLGAVSLSAAEFIPYAERSDVQPDLSLKTPHFDIAQNLSGGPLNIFAISSVTQGRDVSELMERLDSKISMVTWDRRGDSNSWGFGDFYRRGGTFDYKLISKYTANSIQGPEKFDAMIMCTPMGWNAFTKGTKKRILSRVEEDGAGLIFVMPFPGGDKEGVEWDNELRNLCALIDSPSDYTNGGYYETHRAGASTSTKGKKWIAKAEHPILDGVPLQAMPYDRVEVLKFKVAEGAKVLIETEDGYPVMAVKSLGKGRVVTFAFRTDGLSPQVYAEGNNRLINFPQRYWEVWFNLLARSAFWASGREFKKSGEPVMLTGGDDDAYLKALQWKDASGKVTDWKLDFKAPSARAAIELSVPLTIDHGKDIPVSFEVPKGLENAAWSIEASEPSRFGDRVMDRIDLDLKGANAINGEGECAAKFPGAKLSKTCATFHVIGKADGKIVAEGVTTMMFSPDPVWDDFEIHCWGGAESVPFLRDFERNLEKQLGVTCQQTYSENSAKEALLTGYRNQLYAGIDGLHVKLPKGDSSQDKSLLIRHPSFSDPAELAAREKGVLAKFSPLAKYKPLTCILADETSLTNYTSEYDFDFHPENIKAFKAKLEAKFKSVEALNKALGTSFKSFADAEPPTTPETRASGNWGLWSEWRSHNDDMWASVFFSYEKWFDKAVPGARLSLSGTQTSTPFDGIDWAKLTPAFHSICGYRGRYQDLQRINFDPTGQIKTLSWVGYGARGLGVHYQMWDNLLSGDSGCGIFWWLSMRNADLAFCQSAKDYKSVFATLQQGIGKQYQLARRSFSPAAVLWSPASQRAAYAAGKFDVFIKTEALIVDSLRSAGFDPYFISEEQLIAGELKSKGAKGLFLPMTLSLGLGEKAGGTPVWPKIKEFMAAGGVVVRTDIPSKDEFLQPLSLPDGFAAKTVDFSSIKADLQSGLAALGVRPAVVVKNKDIKDTQKFKTFVHELKAGKDSSGYLVSFLLLPEDIKQVFGADGVATWESASGASKPFKLSADCSAVKKTACYNQRTGKLVELSGGELNIDTVPAEANIFAFLPYAVKGVTVESTRVKGFMKVKWQIEQDKPAGAEAAPYVPHVVRVDLISCITGQPTITDNCRNVTSDASGKGEISIPLSIDDENVLWGVNVTDMVTGMKGKVEQK